MQSVGLLGLLVVLALSVASVDSKPVTKNDEADADKEAWEAWKNQFGKSYPSAEEESRRKSIWLGKKKIIEEHNKLAEQGLESYTMGLNYFSDMEHLDLWPHQEATDPPLLSEPLEDLGLWPHQEATDLPLLSEPLPTYPPNWT